MKNYIIAFILFIVVQTLQAQNDTVQNQTNQATESNQIKQSDETTQSNDSTQNDQSSQSDQSNASDDAAITDEELEKYAVTMDSVNDMKESLLEAITAKVKSNEKLTMTRYNDLSKIIDDEAALTKAKATPQEVAFIKEVATMKEEGTTKIQETFQSMAKDFVGGSAFNKIKKSLPSDPELQKRYQAQMDKLGTNTDKQN
jgi:hypothetical protein